MLFTFAVLNFKRADALANDQRFNVNHGEAFNKQGAVATNQNLDFGEGFQSESVIDANQGENQQLEAIVSTATINIYMCTTFIFS